MNAQDLLSAFSEIDPAYLHEAQQRAAASERTWAANSSRPQRKEHTMKKNIKRIAAGLSAAAAVCALAIGVGIYYQNREGYTMQSSIVPVEPVTDTTVPADAPPPADGVLPLAEAGSDLIAGQHVLFGDYEWRVLDIQDGRALLITEYGIDCRPYNDELADVTWETCSLRAWLNGDFYNSFSEEDRARILTVTNENPDAFFEGTGADLGTHTVEGGNDTEDTFFCLSVDEANQYFCTDSEEDMLCKPTQEAIDKGVFLDNGYCTWWLRSPGYNSQSAAVGDARIYVPNYSDGNFGSITRLSGKQVNTVSSDEPDTPAVRPAVWVQIEQ